MKTGLIDELRKVLIQVVDQWIHQAVEILEYV